MIRPIRYVLLLAGCSSFFAFDAGRGNPRNVRRLGFACPEAHRGVWLDYSRNSKNSCDKCTLDISQLNCKRLALPKSRCLGQGWNRAASNWRTGPTSLSCTTSAEVSLESQQLPFWEDVLGNKPDGPDPISATRDDMRLLKKRIKSVIERNLGSGDSTHPLLKSSSKDFFERPEKAWRPVV